ncbi:MAG TPA: hypothetical protein PK629_08400 [Oscillospiraceae bacterium]|nr:hypothetical protein [Oscillospiraceae bacterium]HPF56515.1 hypothetical protein [Clostridiales bacterium]HPK35480.1 hypothetical protein [Oscillospiraceae bacterium]HPR75204.1 hypothetical protein [Oscillospiraceae bacterium]
MKEPIIFCDLKSRVISGTISPSGWRAVDYEIGDYKGNMLLARKGSDAGAMMLSLGLHGWHRIYLCLLHIENRTTTYFKLDSDRCHYPVYSRASEKGWGPYEYVEEVFWKCADLTGQNLTIEHHNEFSSALVWVRCEPMSEQEVADHKEMFIGKETKRLYTYVDPGIFHDYNFKSIQEYGLMINAMADSDIRFASQDVSLQYTGYESEEETENKDAACREMVNCAHKFGIQLYAANRMNLANFCTPFNNHKAIRFVDEHPEFNQVNRCGKVIDGAMSYAYEAVRQYQVNWLTDRVKAGFDGVSLVFTRGIHVAFEEPVKQLFEQRYPGVNPCELPVADERLNGVWCAFMTGFMRELRVSLDELAVRENRKKPKICVHVYYDVEGSKNFGLDVETWAREGLIDSVIQSNMTHFEDLGGCMKTDQPSVIDLEKLSEKLKTQVVLRRRHFNEVENICKDIPKFKEIADRYHIRVYSELPWERERPSIYLDAAKRMYAAGADGIAAWDSNFRIPVLPVWNITKKLGHKEEIDRMLAENDDYGNLYRVLSIDGHDISEYHQNWRG